MPCTQLVTIKHCVLVAETSKNMRVAFHLFNNRRGSVGIGFCYCLKNKFN